MISNFSYRFVLDTNHKVLVFISELADSRPEVVANFGLVPEHNYSCGSKAQKVIHVVFALLKTTIKNGKLQTLKKTFSSF